MTNRVATLDDWDSDAYDVGSYMQNLCANQVLDKVIFSPNSYILDLGCGNGRSTADLLKYADGAKILGVDISPRMVASANERFSNESLKFEELNVTTLNEHSVFDFVVSFFCLDWIEDQFSMNKRIFQALKPGGRALLVVSTGNDPIAKVVETTAASEKWATVLGGHKLPAALHETNIYKEAASDAGFVLEKFEAIQIPLELPDISAINRFVSALPLFTDVLTPVQNTEIVSDITNSFEAYCDSHYGGKVVCLGEMIVIELHKPG